MGNYRFSQTYRLIPVLLGSLLIFAVICLLFLLLWSLGLYLAKTPVAEGNALPVILWLAALAISTAAMTIFTRGGTVYPALFLALVSVILTCFFAEAELLTFGGVLLKLLLSLLAAVLAFVITKLVLIFRGRRGYPLFPRRRQAEEKAPRNDRPVMIQVEDEDLSGFVEPPQFRD